MTTLNFPSSPTVGQTYTAVNKTWRWDGTTWIGSVSLVDMAMIDITGTGGTFITFPAQNIYSGSGYAVWASGKFYYAAGAHINWLPNVATDHTALVYAGIASMQSTNWLGPQSTVASLTVPDMVLAYGWDDASEMSVSGWSALSSVSFPNLKWISSFQIANCPSLANVTLSSLEYVYGLSFDNTGGVAVTVDLGALAECRSLAFTGGEQWEVDLHSLATCYTLTILYPSATQTFPLLKTGSVNLSNALNTALSFPSATNLSVSVNVADSLSTFSMTATESGGLWLDGVPLLATVSAPMLLSASFVSVTGSNVLSVVDLPSLESVEWISIDSATTLPVDIDLSALTTASSVNVVCRVSSLSLPLLANGGVTVSSPGITSLSFPSGVALSIGAYECADLVSVSSQSSITFLELYDLPSLTTIAVPLTTVFESIYIERCPSLTSFVIPSAVMSVNSVVNLTSNALTQASVDGILASLAALDGTNGTSIFTDAIHLTGGTNATPSATGLAHKEAIQARGGTVTNN